MTDRIQQLITHIRIGQRPQSLVIFLAGGVPEGDVVLVAVDFYRLRIVLKAGNEEGESELDKWLGQQQQQQQRATSINRTEALHHIGASCLYWPSRMRDRSELSTYGDNTRLCEVWRTRGKTIFKAFVVSIIPELIDAGILFRESRIYIVWWKSMRWNGKITVGHDLSLYFCR